MAIGEIKNKKYLHEQDLAKNSTKPVKSEASIDYMDQLEIRGEQPENTVIPPRAVLLEPDPVERELTDAEALNYLSILKEKGFNFYTPKNELLNPYSTLKIMNDFEKYQFRPIFHDTHGSVWKGVFREDIPYINAFYGDGKTDDIPTENVKVINLLKGLDEKLVFYNEANNKRLDRYMVFDILLGKTDWDKSCQPITVDSHQSVWKRVLSVDDLKKLDVFYGSGDTSFLNKEQKHLAELIKEVDQRGVKFYSRSSLKQIDPFMAFDMLCDKNWGSSFKPAFVDSHQSVWKAIKPQDLEELSSFYGGTGNNISQSDLSLMKMIKTLDSNGVEFRSKANNGKLDGFMVFDMLQEGKETWGKQKPMFADSHGNVSKEISKSDINELNAFYGNGDLSTLAPEDAQTVKSFKGLAEKGIEFYNELDSKPLDNFTAFDILQERYAWNDLYHPVFKESTGMDIRMTSKQDINELNAFYGDEDLSSLSLEDKQIIAELKELDKNSRLAFYRDDEHTTPFIVFEVIQEKLKTQKLTAFDANTQETTEIRSREDIHALYNAYKKEAKGI